MAGCWPFFVGVSMSQDGVEVHKHTKKRTRPVSTHLDQISLVNKGFTLIWKKKHYSLVGHSRQS